MGTVNLQKSQRNRTQYCLVKQYLKKRCGDNFRIGANLFMDAVSYRSLGPGLGKGL